MYKSIIEKIPHTDLIWVATGAYNEQAPKWMQNYESYIFPFFIFHPLWLKIFTKPIINFMHYFLLYNIYAPIVAEKIANIVKTRDVKLVWIEGVKQNFKIGKLLTSISSVPIHLSMNDNFTGNTNIIDRNLFIKKSFLHLLHRSNSLDFISEGMVDYYREQYGFKKNNYQVFWIGNQISEMPNPTINKEITRIIFYGSIHGLETIHSFCQAIQLLRASGCEIIFDIYSEFNYAFLEKKFKNVSYRGKREVDELKYIIQGYDLVYVPMPFSKSQHVLAKTSISSKMLLALQCQIPILAHGPCYANNVRFVKKYVVGFSICSKKKEDIINEFNRITYRDRVIASKNEKIVYLDNFETEKKVKDFLKFLTVSIEATNSNFQHGHNDV